MTDEPRAEHVIEALARVMRDLPGIGKDQQASAQQGGYAYRGIEQVTVHTQGLFAKHGVVFTPHVVSYEVRDLTINNKPWTDVYEMVEYTVYGPGGITDCIKVGPILAIGRDNSDKGGNKCLTQAFKYALLQALSISDAKDDGDGVTHEADALRTEPPAELNPKAAPLAARLAALPADAQEKILAWFGVDLDVWPTLADEHLDKLAGVISKAEVAAADPVSGLAGDESEFESQGADGNPMDSAPTDVVARLVARMEALPSDGDDLRTACRHGFESTFGNPEQLTVCDVPEAMALITTFEEAAAAGAPASGDELAARAARRAQHGPDEAA